MKNKHKTKQELDEMIKEELLYSEHKYYKSNDKMRCIERKRARKTKRDIVEGAA